MFPDPPSGNRTNIEWRNSTYGGGLLLRRTLFKVFVNQNEVILLGSTAVGITNGDVLVYNPGTVTGPVGNETIPGAANFSCLAQRAGSGIADQGQINSRAEELAGPDTVPAGGVPGGYTPCTYVAPVTGIYNVVFYGPVGNNSNAQGTVTGEVNLANVNNFDATQSTAVAGWDVTVRANLASNVNVDGRLFTYYLTAFTGGNGRNVNSVMFAVTTDGYRYQTDMRGLDPNGFVLYGNQVGYYDSDGTTPLLRDAFGSDNQLAVIDGGVTIALPSFPLFFNTPAPATITGLGITLNPIAPVISNLAFTGTAGGNNSLYNTGGTFTFNSNVASVYQLVISRDGVDFDPTNPLNKALRGVIPAGAQSIPWNGLANDNNPFPVGNNYQVRAEIRAGEYHFPLMDAENSVNGGPAFTLLNPPAGCPPFTGGCSGAFYDDRGYLTVGGTLVGTAVNVLLCGNNPPAVDRSNPFTGFNSAANPSQRAFGAAAGGNAGAQCAGSFGDVKGLDLWTFYPSNTIFTPLNIIISADLALTKDDGTATYTPGGTTTYTITVTNNGLSDVTGATVTDNLPPAITSATWTCAASAGSACGAAAGVGNINTTVDLLNGGSATFTVVANIAAGATGNLTNTACVAAPAGVTDPTPGNNCGTDIDLPPGTPTATPGGGPTPTPGGGGGPTPTPGGGGGPTPTPPGPVLVDPVITKEASVDVARIGDAVTFTLRVTNPNSVPVTNVVVNDPLPVQLDFISVSTTFGSCAFDSGARAVNCNLGQLAPQQVVTITIQTRVNNNARPPETVRNVMIVDADRPDRHYRGEASDALTLIPDEIPVTGIGPGPLEMLATVGLVILAALAPLAAWLFIRRLRREA